MATKAISLGGWTRGTMGGPRDDLGRRGMLRAWARKTQLGQSDLHRAGRETGARV